MKRLLAAAIVMLAAFALTPTVRADVTQPEGEMPTCEVPGITAPRDRSAVTEQTARISAGAESSRPAC